MECRTLNFRATAGMAMAHGPHRPSTPSHCKHTQRTMADYLNDDSSEDTEDLFNKLHEIKAKKKQMKRQNEPIAEVIVPHPKESVSPSTRNHSSESDSNDLLYVKRTLSNRDDTTEMILSKLSASTDPPLQSPKSERPRLATGAEEEDAFVLPDDDDSSSSTSRSSGASNNGYSTNRVSDLKRGTVTHRNLTENSRKPSPRRRFSLVDKPLLKPPKLRTSFIPPLNTNVSVAPITANVVDLTGEAQKNQPFSSRRNSDTSVEHISTRKPDYQSPSRDTIQPLSLPSTTNVGLPGPSVQEDIQAFSDDDDRDGIAFGFSGNQLWGSRESQSDYSQRVATPGPGPPSHDLSNFGYAQPSSAHTPASQLRSSTNNFHTANLRQASMHNDEFHDTSTDSWQTMDPNPPTAHRTLPMPRQWRSGRTQSIREAPQFADYFGATKSRPPSKATGRGRPKKQSRSGGGRGRGKRGRWGGRGRGGRGRGARATFQAPRDDAEFGHIGGGDISF